MMEKRNIDRLFQEKLKGLEASPSPKVWSAIEEKLQKKKRRILPIWWFLSGAAAMLVLGLFLIPFSDGKQIDEPIENQQIITVSPENNIDKKEPNKNSNTPVLDKNTEETPIVSNQIKNKRIHKKKPKTNGKMIASIQEKAAPKGIQKKEKKTKEKEKEPSKEIPTETENLKPEKDAAQQKSNELPKKDFITSVLNKKDTVKIKKRWSVSPVFAVLASNSFSGESPIDNSLSSNPISGETTFSYGVKVAYQFHPKWTVQSGIHVQNTSFTTKNIASTGFSVNSLANVGTVSAETVNSANAPPLITSVGGDAVINQTYGYIEVPIEVKYSFLEHKKFSTEFVAGFSSLFLNQNEVQLRESNTSRILGEATNLNSLNFSGNLGVDFNYSFNKKWTLNINPMLKAQLNTFSRNANGFQPYFLGIYTGVKYQF